MKTLYSFIAAFLVLLLVIGFATCTDIVPPDRVGVRSNQLGEGVEKKDLDPGLWLVIPGIHKLDLLDATLQRLNFGGSGVPGSNGKTGRRYASSEMDARYGTTEGPLILRTRDQYSTTLDITIFYRITPGKGHEVLLNMGPAYAFRERFRQQAEAALWQVMGEMITEDFYDSEVRTKSSEDTAKRLNEVLKKEKMYLEVESVLIRKVVFDPKFEEKLIAKQLLDQRRLLAQSQELRENEQKKTELIVRETENKVLAIDTEREQAIVTLEAQTQARIAQIKADADLKVRTLVSGAERERAEKLAESEKLRQVAEAVGRKAVNAAYQSPGGKLIISQRMIENLQLGEIIINTNQTNPFDVNQVLDLVGAEER